MTLVDHDFKVYVGDYCDELMVHPALAPPGTMNPKDFFEHANSLRRDVYSNNMDFVRFYKPENVLVVYDQLSIRKLTEHPDYEKAKDHGLNSGEMVSWFGFDWVVELL